MRFPTGDHSKEELDKVTRILCGVMKHLKRRADCSYAGCLENVPELKEWWEDHQRLDRVREAEEARRKAEAAEEKAAIDKLSLRERELLGIKPKR